MRLIIDLDGTICSEEKTYSRSLAKLKPNALSTIKALKKQNYTIIIYSARSWSEYEMTYDWLKKNKIPFDQLVLGKPIGDYWIDDRAIKFKNWEEINKKLIKKQ